MWFAAVVALLAAAIPWAHGADITTIRVNTFPNAKALPVHVAIAKGIFANYRLAVAVESTESSQSQAVFRSLTRPSIMPSP